jgi:hypothetical protein
MNSQGVNAQNAQGKKHRHNRFKLLISSTVTFARVRRPPAVTVGSDLDF